MGIISERLFKTNTEVWTMMNEKEFTALAEAYMDMVYRIALNVVGNRSDAEDTVQNVMLRLYKSAPVFESEQHAKHWLIRVTMNESKRIAASPWKKREAELDEAARGFAAEDSLQRSLLRQVAELAPKYRVVLYLYYFEGYSVKEIGEILGRRVSTVQTQLARGRDKLKEALKEEAK